MLLGGMVWLAKDKVPKREHVSHWLSWALPIIAVLLPLLYFFLHASIPTDAMHIGDGRTALAHGDFLIPVAILCADALARWFLSVTYNQRWQVVVGAICCVFCFIATIVCIWSFPIAVGSSVTSASTRSMSLITWACFATGGAAGFVAAYLSMPVADVMPAPGGEPERVISEGN